MARHLLASLPAFLLLAACAQQQSVPAPAAEAGGCHAQAAQFAIGYASTDALAAEVRRRSGARVLRVIRPDEVTTMEYNGDRINLEVNGGNRVTRVRCG